MAKKKTPAETTWTPENLQSLASAYAALNPGWMPPGTPPPPTPGQIVQSSPAYGPQLNDLYAELGISFDANGNPVYGGGDFLAGEQNFGFDQNGKEIGATLPDGSPNPAYNPFSKLNLMKKAFENQKQATVNGYAAAGQLYAGSLINKKNADQSNYDTNYSGVQSDSSNYYRDLVNRARGGRDTATASALSDYTAAQANAPAPALTPNLGVSPSPSAPSTPKPKKFKLKTLTPGRVTARLFSGNY